MLSLARSAFMAYARIDLPGRLRASVGRITLAALCAIVAATYALASIACAIFAVWRFALLTSVRSVLRSSPWEPS